MMFQEWTFLPFFIVAYGIFLLLSRTSLRNTWLLIVSYAFYGLWNPLYLILIAYSTIVDYVLVMLMERGSRKRLWLSISIVNNLALLGYFKYAKFVAENLNALLSSAGASCQIPMPGLLMPVGLSFFIFKSIAYVMDCYRGAILRERNIIRYALFVSFFPLLIAGPIERAANLLAQIRERARISGQDISDGLSLFIVGLFKKLALADALAVYVDRVYKAPADADGLTLAVASFAFAWQIYFDFSGYTDMARGVARLFGFRIMLNFNHPYLAVGLTDFWRRWHISLSSWFRDYLYIPLGGNRKGAIRTYINLIVTMVVSGFWHGAAWNFIIWGAIHGFGAALTRRLERSQLYETRVPTILKQVFCFLVVTVAWVFFRAPTFADAMTVLSRIATGGLADPRFPVLLLVLTAVIWLYQFAYESRVQRILNFAPIRVAIVIGLGLYLVVAAGSGGQAFIYNQF